MTFVIILLVIVAVYLFFFAPPFKLPLKKQVDVDNVDDVDKYEPSIKKAVYNVDNFPKLKELKKYVNDIRKEAENITKINQSAKRPKKVWVDDEHEFKTFLKTVVKENDKWINAWEEGQEWYNYPIIYKDTIIPGLTREICPVTVSLLSKLKGVKVSGFSKLTKDGYIRPHVDENGPGGEWLTYHLCLTGDCTLNVDGQKIKQLPGKDIIFNSEYEHSVSNDAKKERIILHILFNKETMLAN